MTKKTQSGFKMKQSPTKSYIDPVTGAVSDKGSSRPSRPSRGPRIKHRCPRRPRRPRGLFGGGGTPPGLENAGVDYHPGLQNPGGGGSISSGGPGTIFGNPYYTSSAMTKKSGFAMKRGSKPNFKDLGSKNK